MKSYLSRLAGFRFPWRSKAQLATELNSELEFHLAMRREELIRNGHSPEEASTLAMAQFGDLDSARESIHQVDRQAETILRLRDLASELIQDMRYAARYLRRAPGFTTSACLTLGLAIAAVTSAFALVDAYLIRPLPFPEPSRLVYLIPGPGRERTVPFPATFGKVDWTVLDGVFAETVAWDLDGFTITGGQQAEYVDGAWVSAGFLTSLGMQTVVGRGFLQEEIEAGAPVALISHKLWIRRYSGDPAVLDRTLTGFSTDRPMEPVAARIIGVLAPESWHINQFTDVLLPLSRPRLPSIARLRPGMTMEEAEARVNDVVSPHVPDADPRWHMTLVSAQDEYVYQVRPVLQSVLAAAVILMLIAGANTAGLLIANGSKRARDIAIRSAIGAGKGRLIRQLITEGIVLASLAGGVGLLLAQLLLTVLDSRIERHLGVQVPGVSSLGIDGTTAGFSVLATLVVALVFTLIPALTMSRPRLSALRAGRSTFGSSESRIQGGLVVTQVASTFLLLVGSSLVFGTLSRMNQSRLGFEPEGLLKAHILIPSGLYPEAHDKVQVVERTLEALGGMPDIESAAVVFPHPFRASAGSPLMAEGTAFEDQPLVQAVHHVVSGGYLETMRIHLTEGRFFSALDQASSEPVIVIGQSLAAALWPGSHAVGRRIRLGDSSSSEPWRRVVGVVADVQKTFEEERFPDTYVPFTQNARGYMAIMVRSRSAAIENVAQRALATVDPAIPLSDVQMMDQVLADRGSRHEFLAVLISSLAAFSLLLAAVALYSSLSWLVSRRTREFSIRIALGAGTGHVLGQLAHYGARRFVIGAMLGLALSLGLVKTMVSKVSGAEMPGVVTYLQVAAVLAVVALLAFLSPVLRALHTDPIQVLRDD